MKIQFLGAAQEVTGSKHLITLDSGKTILLDCGMYQGKGLETDAMNRDLGFDPQRIDYLVLSHAHIDHSGLIPYLVNLGFKGKIFSTNATRDLCSIMFADAAHIQEHDTKVFNKRRIKKGLPPVKPLYDSNDAAEAMNHFISLAYNSKMEIAHEEAFLTFTDAGHILGSAVVNLELFDKNKRKVRLAFTGDVGRSENRILRKPQPFPQADYILTESTYGDRLHTDYRTSEKDVLKIVKHTCVDKKGKLLIPSFSVGRTQEIVYTLDRLQSQGKLPKIKVYVDSPLSTNATNIFRMHPECFNKDIREYTKTDPDPFGFNNLRYVMSSNDSKKLNDFKEPCIIISASGMMEAGRIKHHLANNITDPRTTIMVVGYCAPRTLGARIVKGEKEVSIHGNKYEVRAEVMKIESYSAHGDYEELTEFLSMQEKRDIKKLFLVHGDKDAQDAFKNHLHKNGFENIEIPALGDEFELV